jgi:lactoylglutathione lyase
MPSTVCDAHYMLYVEMKRTLRFVFITTLTVLSPSSSFPLKVVPSLSRFSSTTARAMSSAMIPGRPTWQQTMLRIKDPTKSLSFYTGLLGFTLIDKLDFPQYSFTVYFLTTLPEGEVYTLTPGTQEAHEYLWSSDAVMLELTHNHGTETNDNQKYHAGNQERDGFGHIAVK